MAYVKKKAKIC